MPLEVQALNRLSEVSPDQWDAVAPESNPFLHYHFLNGLEQSGCVGTPQSGWIPRHIVVRQEGIVVGALPLYEKYDSYGEYIFDWSWARPQLKPGLTTTLNWYPQFLSRQQVAPDYSSATTRTVQFGRSPKRLGSCLRTNRCIQYPYSFPRGRRARCIRTSGPAQKIESSIPLAETQRVDMF